MLMHNPFRK